MKLYLSPSTQENNTGKGSYGTEEKRMNELADHVEPLLKFNGFTVYRNKPSMTLAEVCRDSKSKIGSSGLHVALHTNAGGGKGTEIWCNKQGRNLAECIYNEVAPITPASDRGVKETSLLMEVREVPSPSVILEVIFHDLLSDADFMIKNMEKVAKGIVKGICKAAGKAFRLPIAEVSKPTPKVFYRVVTGSFSDMGNAERRVNQLKDKGFDSFIDVYKK